MANNMMQCPCGCGDYIDRSVVSKHLNEKLGDSDA